MVLPMIAAKKTGMIVGPNKLHSTILLPYSLTLLPDKLLIMPARTRKDRGTQHSRIFQTSQRILIPVKDVPARVVGELMVDRAAEPTA